MRPARGLARRPVYERSPNRISASHGDLAHQSLGPTNGWAVDGGDFADDDARDAHDAHDAAELYRILEQEVVPQCYDRDADGIRGRGWRGCARRCARWGRGSAPRALCASP